MYRLTVALTLALASTLCQGAGTTSLTLKLTDGTTGQPVTNAVVILEGTPASDPVSAEIIQKNRKFHPPTLVIPQYSKVDFPNRDNTQHHVYSFSPAKTFNIELYAGRPAEPVVFNQPGVVEIGCNIHDHMQAFIIVTAHALAGRSDEKGRLDMEISPIAANRSDNPKAELRIWHPRMTDNTRMSRFTIEKPYPDFLTLSIELSPEPAGSDRLDSLQDRFREI